MTKEQLLVAETNCLLSRNMKRVLQCFFRNSKADHNGCTIREDVTVLQVSRREEEPDCLQLTLSVHGVKALYARRYDNNSVMCVIAYPNVSNDNLRYIVQGDDCDRILRDWSLVAKVGDPYLFEWDAERNALHC